MKKFISIRHYLAYLRKQPHHMQHIYSIIFAGVVTALLAAFILYTDYGFWHERYVRNDDTVKVETEKDENLGQSPLEMFSSFVGEAAMRISTVKDLSERALSGKEVYVNEGSASSTQGDEGGVENAQE